MSISSSYLPAGQIFCPGCHVSMREALPFCVRCGYQAEVCVRRFPFQPPLFERIIDPEGRFAADVRRETDRLIDLIEATFPQVRVHLCVGPLAAGVDVREFGFWLFNAATPPTLEDHELRFRSMLMVIDTSSRTASLTVGYGLEPLFDENSLSRMLEAGRRELRRHRWREGLAKILRKLHHELLVAHRTADDARRRTDRHRQRIKSRMDHAPPLVESPGW